MDGLQAVALDRSADGLILNIGNPHEVTIRQLAEEILRMQRVDGAARSFDPRRPGDPERRRRPDIDAHPRALRLGAAGGPRADGLEQTIDDFRDLCGGDLDLSSRQPVAAVGD